MSRTIITHVENKIELNDVKDVVVTTSLQDANGDFVREFRFVGTPEFEADSDPVVLVVRIKSVDETAIRITTPNLEM